jgi:hypothetical protein
VSALPVFFDWGSWKKVETMSRDYFHKRFAQLVPEDQVDATYDKYIVPTPARSGGTGSSRHADPLGQSGPRALAADRRRARPHRRRQHDPGESTTSRSRRPR